jgi:LacI family transcriptional regulator
MKKKVTLSDVAAAATTSIKTASRVINGDENVTPEVKVRVEEAVETLGYQVNLLARSLRKGVDDVLAVVVPTIGDKFFATAIEEIEAVALERDTQIIIASNHLDPSKEKQVIRQLEQRKVSGMIIVPNLADYSFMKSSATPTVFLDRGPNGIEADVVKVGDVFGAQLATEHLIAAGHRNIAFISDDVKIRTARLRVDGYKAALAKHEIAFKDKNVFLGAHSVDDAARITTELLRDAPEVTAIFSSRSVATMGVLRTLHERNRQDIAIISFGDFEMARVVEPKVSVIDHSPRELGRLAAERIFAKIDGEEFQPETIMGHLSIIRRGSGELPPREVRNVNVG